MDPQQGKDNMSGKSETSKASKAKRGEKDKNRKEGRKRGIDILGSGQTKARFGW